MTTEPDEVIDIPRYYGDPEVRALADSTLAAAGLDPADVERMERFGDRWRVCLLRRNLAGKRYVRRGEVARRWVEIPTVGDQCR